MAEAWRGGRASLRWVIGAPIVNAIVAFRARDKSHARALIAAHFARFLETCRISVALDGPFPAPGTGCVVCYNETSFGDVAAFCTLMWPHLDRAAAADLYAYFPLGRSAAAKAGIEMVPRGNRQATERLMERMVEAVRRGERLAWGGEGRLHGRDGVGRFKVGASLIAIRAQAPVVPVAFHGGHRAMPLGSILARPGHIQARFSTPIPTKGLEEGDARALADRVQEVVSEMYADLKTEACGKDPR